MEETSESLIAAIEHNRTDIVRSVISTCENNLIDDGEGTLKSIINEPFTEHGTVLHFATKLGQKDIIRTLLAAGADPGTQNQTGQTAVEMATDDQILQPFNEHLLQAIAHSNLGSVCQLLAAGLDVNLFDSPTSQNTPLHWATSYSDHHMVHALIKRGARVNAANSEGVTPLHEAVNRGDKAIIAELLKENADVEVKPSEGKFESQTPFEMASSRPSLIRLFNNSDSLNGDLHETDENESSLSEGSIQHHKTNGFIPSKSTNNQHCNGTVTMDTVTMDTITMDTVTVNCDEVYASNKIQTSSASKQHAPQRLVTDSRLHYLWPQPQHIFPISPTQTDGDSTENSTPRVEDPTSFCVSGEIMLYVVQNAFFSKDLYDLCEMTSKTWTELHSIDVTIKRYNPHIVKQPESKISLLEQTLPAPEIVEPAEIFAEINKQLCTKENGYKITVQAKQIRILAHDICGMFYALQTIQQLFQLCAEQGVPLIHISDWPTIRDRGILLDLSKGRIHTMNSLRVLITTLASLKVNELYLYMRFTPVTDVDDFWQFPYSSCDLLMLSSFCEAHHMTLSPVFDVTSEVTFDDLSMLQMAFNKSLVCFPNTGVVSIGPRLSSLLIDTSSYLHNLSLFINHTIQLCAYVFHDSTNALNSLPPNTSLIEYGFTADYDFYSQCTKYIESGNCFSVMCGTAAWNSLAGCPEAAMANIFNAVDAVSTVGGIGLILAQWSGLGHLTSHCISWPAFIAMAGLTWNNHIHSDYMYANIADLIDYHMVNQPHCRLGEVIINLGRTETYLIRSARQQSGKDQKDLPSDLGSLLYQLLSRPDETSIEQLTPEVIHKITRHIHQSQSILKPLTNTENLTAIDSAVQLSACDIVVQELELAMALMLTACRIGRGLLSLGTHQNYTSVINVGVTNLLPTQKTDIANRLLSHMAAIKDVWTLRHSDTNIATSTALLQTLLHKLIPDTNTKC